MPVFAAGAQHEQVVFCADPASGLRAIIAIHSTVLGPALGGVRYFPYADEQAALDDVLDLAKAMAYKNACAGLDHGGGKAVILGDPAREKTEGLLRAYGRFVESLGGRYITACDVGTTVEDMDVVSRECRFVTDRSEAEGGAGDSAILTAVGVLAGLRAAAAHVWGSPSLAGRRVAVSGVGKVGHRLVGHLVDAGADVVVADVDPAAVERVQARHAAVQVADPATLPALDVDVFCPCALGHAITPAVVDRLAARVVCGAANNQLADPGVADLLAARGVVYVPDFVVNAGGVIQVAYEWRGWSQTQARARAERIFDTAAEVLRRAAAAGVTPTAAAERLAEERMAAVGRVRRLWLPGAAG